MRGADLLEVEAVRTLALLALLALLEDDVGEGVTSSIISPAASPGGVARPAAVERGDDRIDVAALLRWCCSTKLGWSSPWAPRRRRCRRSGDRREDPPEEAHLDLRALDNGGGARFAELVPLHTIAGNKGTNQLGPFQAQPTGR